MLPSKAKKIGCIVGDCKCMLDLTDMCYFKAPDKPGMCVLCGHGAGYHHNKLKSEQEILYTDRYWDSFDAIGTHSASLCSIQ